MSIILILTALLGLQALALTGLALLAQEGVVRPPKGRTILGTLRGATVGAGPSAQTIRTARRSRAVESKRLRAARLEIEAKARMNSANPSKRVSTRLEGHSSKASRRRQRREEAALLEQALQHPRLEANRAKRAAARKARLLRWRKPAETNKTSRSPKRWGSGSPWTRPDAARVEIGLRVWRLRRRQADLAQEWAGLEVRRRETARRIKSLELRLRGLEASCAAAGRKARGVKAAAARWQTDASLAAAKEAMRFLAGLHDASRQLRAQKARLEATDLSLTKAQAVVDVQLSQLGVRLQEVA